MQKCVALFLWPVNNIMKRRTVLWAWYPIDEIELAKKIDFNLFPGTIVKQEYYDINKADRNDYNVILIDHFFTKLPVTRIKEDLSWADLIIHYTPEIVYGPWQEYEDVIFEHFNNRNFITVCNGLVDMPDHPKERVLADAQTFFTRVARYSPKIELENVDKIKPVTFDALLGKKDLRRDKVYEMLKGNNLLDQNFVNYYHEQGKEAVTVYRSPIMDKHDGNPITGFSATPAQPGGIPRSHMVPTSIYESSWFSVVAETNSRTTFITEKIAKCLLAGRMFVLFGEKGHLAKLQSYGYKTFAPHIDESYDEIDNEDDRIQRAFEQVKALAQNKDIANVIKQLHPTFLHNQKLLLDNESRLQRIKNFLCPYLIAEK